MGINMNYVDIIVIVFIGLIILEGYRKGLVKMLFELAGLIVAFFLSKELSFIVQQFLTEKTKFYGRVHDFFQTKAQWLTEIIQEGTADVINKLQDSLKLPQEMKTLFIQSYESGANTNSFDVFVNLITDFVMKSISFLITFLIIYFILLMAVSILNTFVKLPLLNISNKVGGAVIGVGKALIILYIVFALASPLIAFMPDNKLVKGVNNSKSGKIFYDNNIILNYLSYKGFYEK